MCKEKKIPIIWVKAIIAIISQHKDTTFWHNLQQKNRGKNVNDIAKSHNQLKIPLQGEENWILLTKNKYYTTGSIL